MMRTFLIRGLPSCGHRRTDAAWTGARGPSVPGPEEGSRVNGPGRLPTMDGTMRVLRKTTPAPGGAHGGAVRSPAKARSSSGCTPRRSAGPTCTIRVERVGAGPHPPHPMTFGQRSPARSSRRAEVHHVRPGAFVAAETHIACGHWRHLPDGRAHICQNLRILGVDTDGAFAEFRVIPSENA